MELEKIGEPITPDQDDIDSEDIFEPRKSILNLFKSKHSIGKMNGHWAFLFKIMLIVTFFMAPTIFAWMVWSTTENFANQYNRDRTTKIEESLECLHTDLTTFQKEISQSVNGIDLNTNRLKELEARLTKLEGEHQITQSKIGAMDGKNTDEHTKILVLLEAIKTKMDMIHSNE